MSSHNREKQSRLHLISKSINQTDKMTHIKVPSLKIPVKSDLKDITLLPKQKDQWNPYKLKEKCMICWKPIDIHGKDSKNYMECRNCHQKAHQNHMLRWLANKNYCPYCRIKW